jgi:hypothetical protein
MTALLFKELAKGSRVALECWEDNEFVILNDDVLKDECGNETITCHEFLEHFTDGINCYVVKEV